MALKSCALHRAQDNLARRHSESAELKTNSHGATAGAQFLRQTRTIPAEARENQANSHGATARAIRHARSPQSVHRDQDRFARRHSESDPTRTIPAERSPRPRQIRTAPQRERSDTHDPRRGFTATKTDLRGATARAIRRARSLRRVSFDCSRRAYPPPEREEELRTEKRRKKRKSWLVI